MKKLIIKQRKWGRGIITDKIKEKSLELIGYEITQKELRLLPYIDYLLKNSKGLDRRRITDEEITIINSWESMGFIIIGLKIKCKKNFYDFMQEILWMGYVEK